MHTIGSSGRRRIISGNSLRISSSFIVSRLAFYSLHLVPHDVRLSACPALGLGFAAISNFASRLAQQSDVDAPGLLLKLAPSCFACSARTGNWHGLRHQRLNIEFSRPSQARLGTSTARIIEDRLLVLYSDHDHFIDTEVAPMQHKKRPATLGRYSGRCASPRKLRAFARARAFPW